MEEVYEMKDEVIGFIMCLGISGKSKGILRDLEDSFQ